MSDKYYIIDSATLTNIANVIREKLSISDRIPTNTIVDRINEIINQPSDDIYKVVEKLGDSATIYHKINNFQPIEVPISGLLKYNSDTHQLEGQTSMSCVYMTHGDMGYYYAGAPVAFPTPRSVIKLNMKPTYQVQDTDVSGVYYPDNNTLSRVTFAELEDMEIDEERAIGSSFMIRREG